MKKAAPCEMWRGSAAVDHKFAYFIPGGYNSMYRYNWHRDLWDTLPACQYHDSALVIVNGVLTTVGGRNKMYPHSDLLTLKRQQWVHGHIPMKTPRSKAAVVATAAYGTCTYLIVIGGYDRDGWVTAVEVLDVEGERWVDLLPEDMLPKPLEHPTATICENQVHVIGQDGDGYSCSLHDLLPIVEPHTPQARFHKRRSQSATCWTALPPLPVVRTTVATVVKQLVIIGGKQGGSPVNAIHQLKDGQWVEIGSMSSGRARCLVVTPSQDRLLIVGGEGKRDVDECLFVY